MRRLMLARHAKSSWGNVTLSDHDRPLSARGRKAAPRVAKALRQAGFVPDLAYSSTSVRTRETWALMESAFPGPPAVEFLRELYGASPRGVLDVIAAAPSNVTTLLVLGHNPSTHALAAYLSETGQTERIDRIRYKFPTGAVAVIELAGASWADAREGGELLDFFLPRLLK